MLVRTKTDIFSDATLDQWGENAELAKQCFIARQLREEALLSVPIAEMTFVDLLNELGPLAPKNFKKWRDAAKQGIPDGVCLFADVVRSQGMESEAKALFQEGVDKFNHTGCKRSLAMMLIESREDIERGISILRELGEKECDGLSCKELYQLYRDGEVVSKSWGNFTKYLKLAAAFGDRDAEDELRHDHSIRGFLTRLFNSW